MASLTKHILGISALAALALAPVFGYDVAFEKIEGAAFKPVPVKNVQVQPLETYEPAPGDKEVGTLTLSFDPGEIGHDGQALRETAATEAAAVGADLALQVSVSFSKSEDISGARFRCIWQKARPKKKKRAATPS